MSLEVSNYLETNNNSQSKKSLKYLLSRKSNASLKSSKMTEEQNPVYPLITIQTTPDKKPEPFSPDNKKESQVNDKNNVQTNTNSNVIPDTEQEKENLSPKKSKHKHLISSKLSNSLIHIKSKSSHSRMASSRSTHSFIMTPLFRRKDEKRRKKGQDDHSLDRQTANTYAQPSKRKGSLRVSSNLSMNSSPGDHNYFSDASSAHSFISSSTTNSLFSAFCKKKTGRRLKRKDFSESIKELGSGATGKIHLVYKKDNPEKYYALKEFVIPQHKISQDNERKFFKHLQSEYTIGTILHHRNVIEVEDFIYNDYYKRNRKERHVYQVMEYCDGGDLFDAIQDGHMSQGNILCYFRQLMEGLAYIHYMGVAHRDLKPENIMFKGKRVLKILDFGAAIMFKTPYSNEIIRSSGIVGSEPYMAPEQFSLKAYDPRTVDIWSCGIIFLAMFYNELPWKSAILSNSKYKLWAEKGKSEIINDLPNGPRQLISRMLEPDPEKRITMEGIFKDKWFRHIYCCLDRETEEAGGIIDYTHCKNNSQVSYTPSMLNSCLRRNPSDAQSNASTVTHTLMNKSSSNKFSDGVVSSEMSISSSDSDKGNMTSVSDKTKINDEKGPTGKKAIFIVGNEESEEEEKDSDSSVQFSSDLKSNSEVMDGKKEGEEVEEEEEEIIEEDENDEELKSFWGLDLKCSHEVSANVSFSK